MSFTNTTDKTFECNYNLPVEFDCIVGGLKAQIKDKEVIAQIKMKAEAKEKYEDAIAGGKAAIYAEKKTVKDIEIMEVKIGQLHPADTCTIKIQLIKDLQITGSSYSLQIPQSFYPDYTKQGVEDGDAGYEFSFEGEIISTHKLSYLSLPDGSVS